jgi:hypothetical protein
MESLIMKRQYFYLMTFIGTTLSYTLGAEQTNNKDNEQKIAGQGALLRSSATVDVKDDPLPGKAVTSPPPISSASLPLLNASAPRDIPQPKVASPTGRVLKPRTSFGSGDYGPITPKSPPGAAHKPQPKNPLKESSAGDEEPSTS